MRIWNDSHGGWWRDTIPHQHTPHGWQPIMEPQYPGQTTYDPFWPRYIGQDTIWQRDVREDAMPLAHNSAAMAAWMDTHSPDPWNPAAFGSKTSLNAHTFGTAPVATYIVDSSQPGCPTQIMDSCRGAGLTREQIEAYLTGPIPWPAHVMPARNGDKGLCIIDIATGIWREYFMVLPVEGKPGHWTALAGGFAVYRPGFDGLIRSGVYAPQHTAGHGTVFGGFDMLGYIGAEEVFRGEIRHALAFTTANFAKTEIPSWPARLSDGKAPLSEADKSPTHGQWARLPATVEPTQDPRTGRPYKPLTQLLIRAAQRYGLVATDTNAWCHAFKAWSSPETAQRYGGNDPWAPGGLLAQHLLPSDPSQGLAVDDFPWHLTEWAPVDWGRPSPDFNLRPGEWRPWTRS